jgi:hypothetical protein
MAIPLKIGFRAEMQDGCGEAQPINCCYSTNCRVLLFNPTYDLIKLRTSSGNKKPLPIHDQRATIAQGERNQPAAFFAAE